MAKRLTRGAGIVMPVSSLPGPYGIGDFAAAEKWLRWLSRAGMRYWQILPLTITDSVGSPFASPSGEAMNPLLISPDWLADDGLITITEVRRAKLDGTRINRRLINQTKTRLLRQAWTRWQERASRTERAELTKWQTAETAWLKSFTSYQAIKDSYGGQPWWTWAPGWRDGRQAMNRLTPDLQIQADWHAWCQWMLAKQWARVRTLAQDHRVTIIGDLPFYVQYDSVEVWSRPELFLLNADRKMSVVSGYRPDIFSHVGQKWGTPVYRWSAHRREHWRWWTGRIVAGLRLYDLIRLDHFVGLEATWHVPIRAKTGVTGHWSQTPGSEILSAIRRRVGGLPFIAEDLGRLGNRVIQFRKKFHIPGSRVLQFAWSGLPDNFHEPRYVGTDMVYYTANHDTNTTQGWFEREAKWYEKLHLKEYFGSLSGLPWRSIEAVMRHQAIVAMIHIADLFSYGQAARINHPGTIHGNWSWRMQRWPSATVAKRLRKLATQTGRSQRGR